MGDSTKYYQLRLRDLFVALSVFAILLGGFAPGIRRMQLRGQVSLVIALAVFFVLGVTTTVRMFFKRHRVERQAGPLSRETSIPIVIPARSLPRHDGNPAGSTARMVSSG